MSEPYGSEDGYDETWYLSDCFSVMWGIPQLPEIGNPDLRIQVDAMHNSSGEPHISSSQWVILDFDSPVDPYLLDNINVTYGASIITDVERGFDNTRIRFKTHYHANASSESLGIGDISIGWPSGWSMDEIYAASQQLCDNLIGVEIYDEIGG